MPRHAATHVWTSAATTAQLAPNTWPTQYIPTIYRQRSAKGHAATSVCTCCNNYVRVRFCVSVHVCACVCVPSWVCACVCCVCVVCVCVCVCVCACVCAHIPPKGERKVALFDMSALVLQQLRYPQPMQRVSEGDGSVFFPMHKKVEQRVPAQRDVSRVLQCVAVCCSALQREMVVCYFQCIKRSKRQLLH